MLGKYLFSSVNAGIVSQAEGSWISPINFKNLQNAKINKAEKKKGQIVRFKVACEPHYEDGCSLSPENSPCGGKSQLSSSAIASHTVYTSEIDADTALAALVFPSYCPLLPFWAEAEHAAQHVNRK